MCAHVLMNSTAAPRLRPGMCLEEGGTAGQQNLHLGWQEVKEMRKLGKTWLSHWEEVCLGSSWAFCRKGGHQDWQLGQPGGPWSGATARGGGRWRAGFGTVSLGYLWWSTQAMLRDNQERGETCVCRQVTNLRQDRINCFCSNELVDKFTAALVKHLSGKNYLSPRRNPPASVPRSFHCHGGRNMKKKEWNFSQQICPAGYRLEL